MIELTYSTDPSFQLLFVDLEAYYFATGELNKRVLWICFGYHCSHHLPQWYSEDSHGFAYLPPIDANSDSGPLRQPLIDERLLCHI